MAIPTGGLPILGTLYPAGSLPIIDAQGVEIPNGADPTQPQSLATKHYVDASLAVVDSFVSDWYVNSSTGNDTTGNGSIGAPYATVEKLSDVLCPGGRKVTVHQNTVVHLAGTGFGILKLNVDFSSNTEYAMGFGVVGDLTSSSNITLSAVTGTTAATSTRGQLTTASGTFVAQKRIRLASGACAFSTGLNANAQNTFVTEWYFTQTIANSIARGNLATVGTTCQVDDLSTTVALDIKVNGHGTFYAQDLILSPSLLTNQTVSQNHCRIIRCDIVPTAAGAWSISGATNTAIFASCRFLSGAGGINLSQGVMRIVGCSVQGDIAAAGTGSKVALGDCTCIDGGSVTVTRQAYITMTSIVAALPPLPPMEIENGSAKTCFSLDPGCYFQCNGPLWGASTAYAVGVSLAPYSAFVSELALSNISFPSTINWQINGNNVATASTPVWYLESACGVVLAGDTSNLVAAAGTPVNVGTANSAGTSGTLARSDHVHNTPFSAVAAALAAANASIGVNSQKITSLLDPTSAQDAATKAYVDAVAQGLTTKPAVLAISPTNVATLSGLSTTVDGIALNTDGQRVGLAGQSTQSQNGIYVVHSGAWTRATDLATGANAAGTYFFVEEGATKADSGWVCAADPGSDVVGTNNLPFVQFSGAGQIIATAPITKSGNVLSLATASAVSIGATNSAGTASTAALSDHTHAVTNLSITSEAQGDILYRNGTVWTRLAAGTSGQYLQTGGAAANPSWATLPISTSGASTGDLFTWNGTSLVPATATANQVTIGNGFGYVRTVVINVDDDAGTIQKLFEVQDLGASRFYVGIGGSAVASGGFTALNGAFISLTSDVVVTAGNDLGTGVGKNTIVSGGSGSNANAGYAWVRGGQVGGTGNRGNAAIGGTVATTAITNWQSMAGGTWLPEADSIPTGNPASGFFLFVDPADHKLKARGSSGTVTILAIP